MGYWQILLLVTLRLVLLLPLSASFGNLKLAATNNPGFISIDCGVDQDYLDKVTGIFYKSDTDFISTGENQDISPDYYYDNEIPDFRRLFQNVRFFPEGRKNCYKLRPEQGKNHNYLVRVFFKYGNYDAKNQIPKFDLYLGVNYWLTVQHGNVSAFLISEFIHFSLTDTIDVCLVNTGSGIPFISALELRLLNDSIYRIESRELLPFWRLNLGNSTNLYLRYSDDAYDRIWGTYTEDDWISVNTTADIDIQGSNNSYKLPVEVWRTAVQPRTSLRSLNLSMSNTLATELYVCFHFAEILQVGQGQRRRREFTISLNGAKYGPITLQYLKPLSICPPKSLIHGSTVVISIDSTKRSDLPPILNGLEIFGLMKPPNSPTDPADVDAIMAIKQIYKINKDDNWQGDPCIPRDFKWTGLNCSYDTNPPRIISLDLSSSKLRGMISSSFSNLKVIQSLDLSYNELTGEVPEFLAELPNLTILNLTGNKLRGPIPLSLEQKSNNGILQLSLDGNPNLCQSDYCGKKKQISILPIVISVIAVSVLLLFSSMVIFCRMKRRGATTQSNKEGSVISKNRSFSYSEIVSITDNFKTIIGEGGFGKVYLGTLKDSTQVAVKLLSQNSRQGYKEFQAEAQLLMIVHHRNLVSLIGYCDDRHNKALIYEYMVYGNLREHLSETSGSILNWDERLQIAVDAAHGLEYLHNGCKPPIIHRDLKTSNILINDKLQAKIADFGLSRAFKNESGSHITTHPAGTYGYLDPEAHATANFSQKSDVYSFGIILLELITGQPAIKRDMTGKIILIQKWVTSIIERGDIQSLVDPRLQGQFDTNSAWKVVETALTCVLNSAIQRPDMSHVLAELKECLAMVRSFGSSQRMEGGRTRSLAIDSEMVPSPR